MDIDRDHILKLAKLANLELNDSQIESSLNEDVLQNQCVLLAGKIIY